MSESSIIKFDGSGGAGDSINLSVPLPSSHTGRRIIILEDIADSAWSTEAKNAGTDYADEYGVESETGSDYQLQTESALPWSFFDRLQNQDNYQGLVPEVRGLPSSELTSALQAAKTSILDSATSYSNKTGDLKNWHTNIEVQLPTPTDTTTFPTAATSKTAIASTTKAVTSVSVQRSLVQLFMRSVSDLSKGILYLPCATWGGGTTLVEVNLSETSQPRLFIIQVLGISSFLGDYGVGKTVKTFTLLPGEETKISTRTWRATQDSISTSSSIIDSYDESSADRFADTVQTETTDTATQTESGNWKVEGEVSASWGWGKASVSGSKTGESSSSTEEFAKAVNEAVTEHTSDASSHRENTVTSSSESSVSSEDETVIERTIKNINVKRVLNFVFRELNQMYSTKIHLKDIKIAFSNGRVGTWREVPLSGLAELLNDLIATEADRSSVTQAILSQIAVIFNVNGDPVNVLERVTMGPCGVTIKSATPAKPGDNCVYDVPPLDMSWYYRFKRGPLAQGKADHPVDGVVLQESDQVLRTDSVIVDALLGTNDALDQYSADLQTETIREKKLANDREELAQQLVSSGDSTKATIFQELFVSPEEETESETTT